MTTEELCRVYPLQLVRVAVVTATTVAIRHPVLGAVLVVTALSGTVAMQAHRVAMVVVVNMELLPQIISATAAVTGLHTQPAAVDLESLSTTDDLP